MYIQKNSFEKRTDKRIAKYLDKIHFQIQHEDNMYRSFIFHVTVETNDNFNQGKCGFGGSSDTENGDRTAKGGINKDRLDSTYSPHHHLHYQAFIAARKATEQFLVDQGMFSVYFNIDLFNTVLFSITHFGI